MSKIFFQSFLGSRCRLKYLWGVKLHNNVHPQVLKIQYVNKCDANIQTLELLGFNPIR
jgi:hypothetical protein